MYARNLASAVRDALADTPVVLLAGARQTGKSTLASTIDPAATYITLDDALTLRAAQADPQGFIESLPFPAILDEVQHLPEIFRPIKLVVDRDRRPGRFLLTGSANVMLLPRLSESLAGRMEILPLGTLSQGEIDGVREGFIDAVFEPGPVALPPSTLTKTDILERAIAGGYPELIGRASARRRLSWFQAYTTTTLQRDVRDLANIEALGELPRLLSAIAARAGSLFNAAQLSSDLGLPQSTLKRYVALLQATFLVDPLPAWSGGLDGRVFRAPKIMLNDSGLLAHLIGATPARFDADATRSGMLLENFVVAELRKQMAWAKEPAEIFFFRTHGGVEVDVVLERADGKVVGIEVKASSSPQSSDLRGLERLRDRLGERFVRGVLLHTGRQTVPFGERLTAMPVDALWRLGARP